MNNYTTRLEAAYAAGHIPRGETVLVDVAHGYGCRHDVDRTSPCACFPLITVAARGELLSIGSDGHVLERRRPS